ncbi:MAG: signal peptidase I [Kofleriaceae bacterium]|nr:signal peptidase I [Kofleriaceae bacterium]MBP9168881.1 signal peptidase I [Kofleriaceae bacterium]MBP9862129.1 signal peptidase I [Kofleriaceae bacterium]
MTAGAAAGMPAAARLDRRVRAEAKGLVKLAAKALRTKKQPAADRAALARDLAALEEALAKRDLTAVRRLLPAVDAAVDKIAAQADKSPIIEYASSIITALAIALTLRAFVVEAFKIPSASMIPTMQIGDFIFVNKLIYGLRMPFTDAKVFDVRSPRRGEVVVFRQPCTDDTDFIKRVVALPGDTVEVRCNRLYVNGQHVVETLAEAKHDFLDYKSGVWTPTSRSRYTVTMDGTTFSVLHDLGQPADQAIVDQGWPAFWAAHEAARRADGAPPEVIAQERAAVVARFPSHGKPSAVSEFPDPDDLRNLPQCKDGKPVAVDPDQLTRRSAPEPSPDSPSCAPRLAYVVPAGHVFAMGDNRDDSNDSRGWGPVPLDHIKGKAMFIWLSLGPKGGLPGMVGLDFGLRWDRVGDFVH